MNTTARGLNKCAWCGKMARWEELNSVHLVEMIDIHGTIAESDYYEHRGDCAVSQPRENERDV